jgi:Tol biopolymer transport system component
VAPAAGSGGADGTRIAPPPDTDPLAETLDSAGGAAPAASSLAPGAHLGDRYQLKSILGRGGMGVVYLASDAVLDRDVALKVLTRAMVGTDGLTRLRNEVLLAQRVTSRNVCRIYDLEEADSRWMIKMEYVAGETLASRIARGPLPVDDALAIARQICDGLRAAHDQEVIHRDLKPQNVMIEEDTGRVVLMDFGIARTAASTGHTGEEVAGTPAYMAPEQVRAQRTDARTDLYALGCVLYHMLVGQEVFPVTAMAAVARHLEEAPPDPRALRPDLPAWLADAIARLLEKEPARRPADVAAALVLLGGPDVRRRRRWVAPVAAAGVLLAAGGAIALVATRHRSSTKVPRRGVTVEMLPTYDENSDCAAFSPDGTLLAYPSDRERTGWFRIYLAPARGGEGRAVTPPDMSALRPAWTHDGASIYVHDAASPDRSSYRVPVARADGAAQAPPELVIEQAQVRDCGAQGMILRYFRSPGCDRCERLALRLPDGERDLLRGPADRKLEFFECDPDGRRVVYTVSSHQLGLRTDADLWILDVAGGAPRRLTTDHRNNVTPTFAPDGRSVVFSSTRSGRVNLWEIAVTGGEPLQLTVGEGDDLSPDVSPDGNLLLFNADVTSIPMFAYSGGGAPRRVTARRPYFTSLHAAPDGRQVIAVDVLGETSRVFAVDVATGSERELATGTAAAATPDGREVVYVTMGDRPEVLAVPLAGGAPRRLGEVGGRVSKLRVGPDGWVHMRVQVDRRREAWRLPLAGGAAEREAAPPWCFVHPAPAGGWRRFVRCDAETGDRSALVRPGEEPDLAAPDLSADEGEFDARGQAFYFTLDPSIWRIDLATGARSRIADAPVANAMTVSPDGKTVFTAEYSGRVRRQLMLDFADRPRP